MMRARRRRYSLILVICALFLLINVGYAALSKQLSLSGVTKVDSMELNVQFTNASADSSATTGSCTASLGDSYETFNFGANLKELGEYCTYTVDVKNTGSIPASISFNSNIEGWDGNSIPFIKQDEDTFFGIKIDEESADSDNCNSDYCESQGDYYECDDGFKYRHMEDGCYRFYDSLDELVLTKGQSLTLTIMYNIKTEATLSGSGSQSEIINKDFNFSLVSTQGTLPASSINSARDHKARELFKGSWRG